MAFREIMTTWADFGVIPIDLQVIENIICLQDTSELRDPLTMRLSLPAASEKVSKSRAILGKATSADHVCICLCIQIQIQIYLYIPMNQNDISSPHSNLIIHFVGLFQGNKPSNIRPDTLTGVKLFQELRISAILEDVCTLIMLNFQLCIFIFFGLFFISCSFWGKLGNFINFQW